MFFSVGLKKNVLDGSGMPLTLKNNDLDEFGIFDLNFNKIRKLSSEDFPPFRRKGKMVFVPKLKKFVGTKTHLAKLIF